MVGPLKKDFFLRLPKSQGNGSTCLLVPCSAPLLNTYFTDTFTKYYVIFSNYLTFEILFLIKSRLIVLLVIDYLLYNIFLICQRAVGIPAVYTVT